MPPAPLAAFFSKILYTKIVKRQAVFLFILISFFISFADAIMSYVSPIFIESRVQNTVTMGIIFSFSSVVGIICDMLFPKLFTNRPHYFFLKATLLSAVMFPLTYLLFPNHVFTFLIAMTIWGIYYELNIFSSFHFVQSYIGVDEHSKAWGIIQAVQSFAYAAAPLLAVELLAFGFTINFILVCGILGLALIPTLLFKKKYVKTTKTQEESVQKKSWLTEIKIWKLLFPKVWHLLLLLIAITIIDAGFWTIGTLYTLDLSQQHHLGNMLLTAYIAPAILVGLLVGRLGQKTGKKRTAIICSIFAGLAITGFALVHSVPSILILTSIASIALGVAVPELKSVFENYVSRLHEKDNEMIGLQSSATSFAYVIGPIISTLFAQSLGYKYAFAAMGAVLLITAVILFFFIPKKIKMPQKELANI